MDKKTLKIAEPCTEDWESMEGEGFKRFCDKCSKHVHDLSDLTQAEAKALLAENAGSNICVVYKFNTSGRISFREPQYPRPTRSQLTGIKKLLAAAAMVPILATLPACDSPPPEQTYIETPCGYANTHTFTPLDEILEAERRMLEDLRDFLGFEPEIEMLAGEPMIDPEWQPQVDLVEDNILDPIPEVLPEPEPVIMGKIAMPEPVPVPEPKPQPRDCKGAMEDNPEPVEIIMGDVMVEDLSDPKPVVVKPIIKKRMGRIKIPDSELIY